MTPPYRPLPSHGGSPVGHAQRVSSLPAGGIRGYWARLEFFDWGIRVRGSKPGGFLLPVFEVRYSELTDARLVAARGRQGIRFRSDALPAPVTFETFADSIPRIVSLLEDRDVRINRETGHIGWLPGD